MARDWPPFTNDAPVEQNYTVGSGITFYPQSPSLEDSLAQLVKQLKEMNKSLDIIATRLGRL